MMLPVLQIFGCDYCIQMEWSDCVATECESCNKDVAVALISMHDCGLAAKIKMNLETTVERPKESVTKQPSEKKKVIKDKVQPAKKVNPSKPKRPPTTLFIGKGRLIIKYR
ncbi:high mobility group B protein 7-like [Rutidosis leptorrhynchoides]|uniref:high mobility group B protein 7-like n=1 Tax=Rutidosis leptorrhynchoides TaxID=125765 RepID=UPI003A9A62ED